MIILSGPPLITALLGLSLLQLLWVSILTGQPERFWQTYRTRFGAIPKGTLLFVTLIFSISITALLWQFVNPLLWRSGNFGEPPYNRYVAITYTRGIFGLGQPVAALVEFGVVQQPTRGVNIAIDFGVPCEQMQQGGVVYAPPHLNTVEAVNKAITKTLGASQPSSSTLALGAGGACEGTTFKVRTYEDAITPNQSIYTSFRSSSKQLALSMDNCYLRHLDESSNRTCSKGVTLIEY
ncbi:MAG: hypothetical protein HY531_00400 [Chloroflexi bacterium]|nr:hypothetical protein [Chloroflexota bacterium]